MKIVYTESIHWNLHRTCNTAEAYDGLADSNFFGLVDSNKVGVTSFQLTQAVVGESLSTGPVYSFDVHETHETFVIFRDGTYAKISTKLGPKAQRPSVDNLLPGLQDKVGNLMEFSMDSITGTMDYDKDVILFHGRSYLRVDENNK